MKMPEMDSGMWKMGGPVRKNLGWIVTLIANGGA